MEQATLLSQILSLIAALTVGAPADEPFNAERFARTVVRTTTDPIYQHLTVLEEADLLPPVVVDEARNRVHDVGFVSEAVIAASVRIPVAVRTVPITIRADIAAGGSPQQAVADALHDVTDAVHESHDDTAYAVKTVAQRRHQLDNVVVRQSIAVAGTVISAQGEVRQAVVAGGSHIASAIAHGGSPDEVKAVVEVAAANVEAAALGARQEVRESIATARLRIRQAVDGDSAQARKLAPAGAESQSAAEAS